MTLNHFIQPKKREPSLKAALRRMRQIWYRGPVNRFDERLASLLDCDLKKAQQIRESWMLMGFLVYDRKMLLCWRNGGF